MWERESARARAQVRESEREIEKERVRERERERERERDLYGVATISRLLEIIGLFCKRAIIQRLYSAKET